LQQQFLPAIGQFLHTNKMQDWSYTKDELWLFDDIAFKLFFQNSPPFFDTGAIKMSTSFVATIYTCFRQLTIIHIYLARYPSKKFMKSLGEKQLQQIKVKKHIFGNFDKQYYFQRFLKL